MIVYKLQSTQEILPVFPDLSADSHHQLNCDKSSKRLLITMFISRTVHVGRVLRFRSATPDKFYLERTIAGDIKQTILVIVR